MKNPEKRRIGAPLWALFVATAVATAGTTAMGEEAAEPLAADDTEAIYLTGLDVSYWADSRATVFGPGLTWGLVLRPERLNLLVTVGAMLGDGTYTVPVELRFDVHFRAASWLDFYLAPGPMLLFDRFDGTWHHDLALSVSGGLSIAPPGADWALRAGGDYNLRLWRDVSNGGGFTVGFLYGF